MKEMLTLLIVGLAVVAYQLIVLASGFHTVVSLLVDETSWTGLGGGLYDPFDLRKSKVS